MKLDINPQISIVLPCRDEEAGIGYCIDQIKKTMKKTTFSYEIVVSDSSSDKSPIIAQQKGARVISHNFQGYGIAIIEGIKNARGNMIIMADADGTYDFSIIPQMITKINQGYDIVLGNRFKGSMDKKAMPFLHKYIGNPFLSMVFRLFFGSKIQDVHSGIRAFKKSTFDELGLLTIGMEFASEMLIKAEKKKLKIAEIPVNYRLRKGISKLSSLRDGWRHLRFMLLYTPLYLFIIPGSLLFILGVIGWISLYFGLQLFQRVFYIHPLFVMTTLIIIGYQLIIFGLFGKSYAMTHLGQKDAFMDIIFTVFSIEKSLMYGFIVIVTGVLFHFFIFTKWAMSGYGELDEIKNGLLGLTLIVLGIQTISSTFMMSMLSIKER